MTGSRLLVIGVALLSAIGAIQAMYGPLFPQFRTLFGLGDAQAGALVSAHFVGSFAGIALWVVGESRAASRGVLAFSAALFTCGSASLAVAPTWHLALAAACLIGLGSGCLVLGVNRLFATSYGRKSNAMLNLVNAAFSIAAISGPIAVGLAGQEDKRWLFAVPGVLSLVILPILLGTRPPGTRPSGTPSTGIREASPDRPVAIKTGALWPAGLFMALFLLYVATEAGIGAWEATYLMSRSYSEAAAASWTGGFWAAIAATRICVAPLSTRIRPHLMVTSSLTIAAVGLALAAVPGLESAAFVLTGLGMAAVFPTSFAWLTQTLSASSIGGFVMAAAMVGGFSGPPLVGSLVARYGIDTVPWALSGLAVACVLCAAMLRRVLPR
ncbi:MAG: MFS transporter [Proteobacteria bacterium]|nr:MFS transporter [Pseudomonadota bacterium]